MMFLILQFAAAMHPVVLVLQRFWQRCLCIWGQDAIFLATLPLYMVALPAFEVTRRVVMGAAGDIGVRL